MSELLCSDCGGPITKASKTGRCRGCHLKKLREANKVIAAEDSPIPKVPEHVLRDLTAFERVAASTVRVHDRPPGPDAPANDPTVVFGKDPTKNYRWVREDSDAIARAAAKGFRPVKRGAGLEAPSFDHGRADKFMGHDGMALMEQPKEIGDKLRARRRTPTAKERADADLNESIDVARRENRMSAEQERKLRGQFVERTETYEPGEPLDGETTEAP